MPEPYRYGDGEPYRLEPTPLYAQLRSREPVARVAPLHGEEGWLVTRHKSVRTVMRDPWFGRAAAVATRERLPMSSCTLWPAASSSRGGSRRGGLSSSRR